MVAPVIALGVYELLAAGAAATGLGAFAVAKRREIADGLSDAADATQHAFRETAIQSLPYIIGAATGTRLWRPRTLPDIADADPVETLPLPGFADAAAWDVIQAPQFPAVPVATDAAPPVVREVPRVGDLPLPPAGGPPEDPLKGLRRIADRAKDIANRVGQNPFVRGAGTLYKWYIYGSAVVSLAEIGRRMVVGSKDDGPILYDLAYQPIFGESVAARALLGGHQVMAAETSAGMVAIALARSLIRRYSGKLGEQFVDKFLAQLPGFKATHAYSFLGNISFFEDQMAANDISTEHVDMNRATRTAAFFGFTSIAFYPLVGVISNVPRLRIGKYTLDGIGRIGFKEWLAKYSSKQLDLLRPTLLDYGNYALAAAWQVVARRMGPQLAARVAPHYVPRFQTFVIYAGFATVYRNITTAIASLPWLEDSDWSESMKMANARSALSIVLTDPYFYLGAKFNSKRAIYGNQLVFMGFILALNQFYSRFDGKDMAIKEADRSLKRAAAGGVDAVQLAVGQKPLTQRNVIVPPYVDLSAETWARLAEQYARDAHLDPQLISQLSGAMTRLLTSRTLDDRRVGMALGVLLTQIGQYQDGIPQAQQVWRRSMLQTIEKAGVVVHPRHAGQPLSAAELDRVFDDINDGVYDKARLFEFPLN